MSVILWRRLGVKRSADVCAIGYARNDVWGSMKDRIQETEHQAVRSWLTQVGRPSAV